MFFRFLFLNSALSRFHSPDLTDMRHALRPDEEDQDGPDGGCVDARPFLPCCKAHDMAALARDWGA